MAKMDKDTKPISLKRKERANQGYAFGTFKGVFTPSILTILGVIMYLRFGWVLGHVGLIRTLAIVTLSTSITFLTSLSISALSTNMRVGGGGAYYIISRSLGIEIGAAVGIPLYFSQAIGIAFYSIGFAESIVNILPGGALPGLSAVVSIKSIAFVTLVGLGFLVYVSADLALKTQFIILTLIGISLVSYFAGTTPTVQVDGPVPEPQHFWPVFAVFFPAVTGILAGVSMSGDLKDPEKSLPRGTLAAVLVSYVIYMAIPFFMNMVVKDRGVLRSERMIMYHIARLGPLILFGLWGATLSSAMGSLLGAPRTLQALARDRVIPCIVGKGFGKGNDPHIATAISFIIGLGVIFAGELNAIAPVLSMFALTTYGLLNLSAAFEGLIGSPSWRPTFKVHWMFSLLGAFGCFAVMFMINAGATFMAAFVSILVYVYVKRKSMNARWGDVRYGVLMLGAQYTIYKLSEKKPDERTWRPNILVLSGSPTSRWYLIELADAISHGKSLLTVASVLPESLQKGKRISSMKSSIAEYLRKRNVPALVKVYTAEKPLEGVQELVRAYGFGPVVPNTILLGETKKTENYVAYAYVLRQIYQSQRNLVVVREGSEPVVSSANMPKKGRRIDVWWGRQRQNAGLMLALGYLLQTSPQWARSRLVLKTIVDKEAEQQDAVTRLRALTSQARLETVETDVIVRRDGAGIFDTIRYASQGASLIFMGMRSPDDSESNEEYSNYYDNLMANTDGFPATALVLAAENIEFHRIFQ